MSPIIKTQERTTKSKIGAGARRTRSSRHRTIAVALMVQGVIMAAGLTLLFREMETRIADHASGDTHSSLLWPAICGGGLILLCTSLATMRLMRQHDRELVAINAGLESDVARRLEQSLAFRDALILGLTKLADFRDTDTGTHLERIAEYCDILARELRGEIPEIDDAYIRRLRMASAMHDIGKVGVEDAILLKPGKLTDDERTRMQQHPLIGADTLLAIRERLGADDLVEMSIIVALEHHERWDGAGYPLRLSGMQIQLPARIVALADVYDALTSERVYKPAKSHAHTVELIQSERGSHFDPAIVDAFIRCAHAFDQARLRLQAPAARTSGVRPGPSA